MSALTKILLVVLLLVFVALGVEAYVFFKPQIFPQTKRVPTPSPSSQISQGAAAPLIEIKGVALVGFLNLFDITKTQVSDWSTKGIVSVPAYSGPLPTIPPNLSASLSAQITTAPRPDSVKVIAGNFKSSTVNAVVLSQAGKDVTLAFTSGARLWIKSGEKVQMAPTRLDDLLGSGKISDYVKVNDLLLAVDVKDVFGQLKSSGLIVFK